MEVQTELVKSIKLDPEYIKEEFAPMSPMQILLNEPQIEEVICQPNPFKTEIDEVIQEVLIEEHDALEVEPEYPIAEDEITEEDELLKENTSNNTKSGKRKRRKLKSNQTRKKFTNMGRGHKRVLPDGYVYCCKKCGKTFLDVKQYRPHVHAHNNPILKCCRICKLEFAHVGSAMKHKQRLHPELFQEEAEQRMRDKMEGRVKPIEYHIIPIEEAKDRDPSIKGKTPSRKKRPSLHLKDIKSSINCVVSINPIMLPGFYKNDWVFLPKDENDYPWVVERKPKPVKKNAETSHNRTPIKTEVKIDDDIISNHSFGGGGDFDDDDPNYSDTSSSKKPLKTIIKAQKQQSMLLKRESRTKKKKPKVKNETGTVRKVCVVKREYKEFSEMETQTPWIDESIDIAKKETLIELTELKMTKKRPTHYIPEEEIPDVPKFEGAKYIYNVYVDRERINEGKRLLNLKKKLGLYKKKERDPNQPYYYKAIQCECKICGEIRSKTNIKHHVASHCYEETETACRICLVEKPNNRKLRDHYTREHKVMFLHYLLEQKQKQKASGEVDPRLNVDYVECEICLMNLKNQADLDFHTETLHKYLEAKEAKLQKNTQKICSYCGKEYMRKRGLIKHLEKQHNVVNTNVNFICDYCNKGFCNKPGLILHFNYEHGFLKKKLEDKAKDWVPHEEETVICELCGEVFKSTWPDWIKFEMMRHNYEKHDDLNPEYEKYLEIYKQNQCYFCLKKFREQNNLNNHLRAAFCDPTRDPLTKRKIYEKVKSNPKYDPNRALPNKTKDQTPTGPSGKRPPRMWKKHKYYKEYKEAVEDLPVRDLTCLICGKYLKGKILIRKHMARFHMEKRFFCDVEGCGKGYSCESDFAQHKTMAHKGGRKCQFCGQVFTRWQDRKAHEDLCHSFVVQQHNAMM